MPGNPRLGTLRWRGRHYVCSTVDRAEQFGVEPDLYIAAVSVHISHNHGVRLQQLCSGAAAGGAAHRAGAARDGGRGRGHGAGPPAGDQVNIYNIYTISTQYLHRATSHAASQTETHPLASPGLDPDYRWNEWDLRREALEVCRMRWMDVYTASCTLYTRHSQ